MRQGMMRKQKTQGGWSERCVRSNLSKRKRTNALQCYLMLALPLIGFFVFTLYPILWTFRWSLFAYNGNPADTRFIGLSNFVKLFATDVTYWKTWGVTLLFAVCKIPVEITVAMILALLLHGKVRGSGFFRSAYYLPSVVSMAVIGLIFSNLFNYFGVINGMLMKLGVITAEVDWFASKATAMAVLVIASIWNTFGVNVMYLLAALSNVPEDVYESADLDGATPAVKFFRITLPMIAPIFQTILLLSLIGTLGTNDIVLTLTGGAPGGQTYTVLSYLTSQFVPGFTTDIPALGYGCAMALITTILLGIAAAAYNGFSKKMQNLY